MDLIYLSISLCRGQIVLALQNEYGNALPSNYNGWRL